MVERRKLPLARGDSPQTRDSKSIDREYIVPCADNPELFFPIGKGNNETEKKQTEAARRLCAQCPEQKSCLQGALERNEQFGLWGGMTPDERRAYKGRVYKAMLDQQ